MLTVTDSAGDHLAKLLDGPDIPQEAVVRFVLQEEGLALQLGSEQPGDTTFSHGERIVLAMDAPIAEALADKTLDVYSTPEGPQLTICD